MMKKVCSICKTEKNIEDFSLNKRIKSGYDARCKECRNEYLKQYRNKSENKVKAKEYMKIYVDENCSKSNNLNWELIEKNKIEKLLPIKYATAKTEGSK